MPVRSYIDTEELRAVVQAAVGILPRDACEVDAYVVHDERMMHALKGIRRGKQDPILILKQDTWKIPSGHIAEALRTGAAQWSDDRRDLCVLCMGASSSEVLGFFCVTSAAWKKTVKRSPHISHKLEALLEASRPTMKYVRSQIVQSWQRSVLHELHNISDLNSDDYALDALRIRILSAALAIAPTACVAHLVTVQSDEETGEPRTLELDYALTSETTPCLGKPELVGPCPEDHALRSYRAGDGVTGQAARLGKRIYFPNLQGIQNYKVFLPTAVSEVAIPLKLRDRVIGVLNLESESKDAFSVSDQENLESLAGLAALHMSATSGFPARINLYTRGVHTLESLFESLHKPHDLMTEILKWARHISVPPLEYAVLNLDEHPPYESGDTVPSKQMNATEVVVPLHNNRNERIGTLALATALRRPEMSSYVKTLKTFGPVLAAAIAASTNETSAATIRGEAVEVLRNVRHTILDVGEALDGAHTMASASALPDAEALVRGALECLRIQSDFLVDELMLALTPNSDFAPVELTRAVRELTHAMEWRFKLKGVALEITPPKRRQIWVKGPMSSLLWALYELLHNAWKFSPRDTVVKVSILATSGSNQVVVQIDDQCAPIKQEQFDDIWKVGFRGENVGSTPGRGRGLAIIKRMCDKRRLNATPSVRNNARGGNTFQVVFPRLQ